MAIQRVVVSGTLYGQESWANVFHIDPPGGFTDGNVFDAFEDAYSVAAAGGGMGWLTPCPGEISTGVFGVRMTQMTLQAVTNPGIATVRTLNTPGGQNTPGGLPLDVALVVSWRTSLAGRSFRGRTYLPPFHENQCVDDSGGFPRPAAATVAGLAVNAAQLIDDLATALAPLVVYSRTLSDSTIITGGFIDGSWDTQRRRGASLAATRVLF